MRRLARHMFKACAAVSLLVCVAVGTLWATSYHRPQFVYYDWLEMGPPVEVRALYWMSDNGVTYIGADRTIADTGRVAQGWLTNPRVRGFQRYQFTRHPGVRRVADGFKLRSISEKNAFAGLSVEVRNVGAPYWFCTAACAVLPLAWVIRQRHGRTAARLRAGLCPACGYDLRASPERCPECGTPGGR